MPKMNENSKNPVASFESGIITKSGNPVGMCIKFRLFDGAEILLHWPMQQFGILLKALVEYIEQGRHSNFMFRVKDDPSLVSDLPPRHPYHTLLSEVPQISPSEVGSPTASTKVASCSFVDMGSIFVLRPIYGNGEIGDIYMHEYTAFSLQGYLDEYVQAYDKLSGKHEGGMQ